MSAVHTLAGVTEYREEIRKSRFLVRAAPVADAAEAMAFIASVSDASASHNCWAYRIGSAYRFSDDGEPGGTAGKPILQAIEGQSCDRVAVVVTRWFGGVKLGTGGLVRAYGGCAANGLRAAQLVPWVPLQRARIDCTFAELPLLRARLAEFGVRFEEESFGTEGASVLLATPADAAGRVAAAVADLTRGRVSVDWQA